MDESPPTPTSRRRVFSGIQPSGEATLGNYLGMIQPAAALIEQYECIYCIVDLHAITQPYETHELPERTFELAVSLISAGIDPERCILFVQSDVPEHTELAWLFNTVTPIGDLQRMTQFKEKSQGLESVNSGLLNYPVLQAADILLYRADLVPVGEDQRQHLELSREIARRWNRRFGEFFPEPDALIGEARRIRGLDGVAKMSKSKNNVIPLIAEPDEMEKIVLGAVTDPARVARTDPGNPGVCNVYALHDYFTDPADRDEIEVRCQTATIGCVDCKRWLARNISAQLEPVQERARELRADPEVVYDALADGAERARAIARETIEEAKERMGLGRRAPVTTG